MLILYSYMLKLTGKTRHYGVIWLGCSLLLFGFLLFTDPLKLPLPVLLIPFILLFVGMRCGVISAGMLIKSQEEPSRKLRIAASGGAAFVLLTLTMQSLGQLSWRDMLLIVGLVTGLTIYFNKTDLL